MCVMKIEELDDGECSRDEEEKCQRQIVSIDAKRALVGPECVELISIVQRAISGVSLICL